MPRVKPIIHNVEQRSQEWHELRLGKVTASRAKDTMAFYKPTKVQVAAGFPPNEMAIRKSYREGIVAERLTGLPADPEPYVSYDMKWGIVNEDIATAVYQMEKRAVVEKAPFFEHPKLKAGVSPDGVVTDISTGEIGLIEVKCLRSANHLYKVIRDQAIPKDFTDQIQMQLWITGYDWCDFVAYDSRLPEGLRIYIERMAYDKEYVDNVLEPNVKKFLDECDNDFKAFFAAVKQ